MLTVPTVLLQHRTASGSHYDWLVGTPAFYTDPASGLWTARVSVPSEDWRAVAAYGLRMIEPHRRAYLTHQGPVSGGRGYVVRAGRGRVCVRLWCSERVLWEVRMPGFEGLIEASRVSEGFWRARVAD